MTTIKYKLKGYILPKHCTVTLPQKFKIPTRQLDHDLQVALNISIVDSVIDVECASNRLGPGATTKALTEVRRCVESAIHLISLKQGVLLTVVMDQAILPDGSIRHLQYSIDGLGELCTAFESDQYVPMWEVASTGLRWVLRDLIGALEPDMATINCARAMDGIRNLIASPDAKDKEAWREMREKLRIDEIYLKYVSGLSKDHRHARYVPMTQGESTIAIKRSWVIMDRYLHFIRLGGEQPLPENDFPLLR